MTMHESLSLFHDEAVRPARPARVAGDRHLEAARRLSLRIGRLADHSDAQVEVGQSICRHLLAMLRESLAATNERGASDPPRH